MNEDSGDRYRADAEEGQRSDRPLGDSVPGATRPGDGFETLAADSTAGTDPGGVSPQGDSVGGRTPGDSDGEGDPTAASGSVADSAASGKVFLVGSGPGDPELLTRKAWRLLTDADFVLHDSLVDDALLDQLPASVEVVDVGKRPPDRTSQADINDMLVDLARDGAAVVRLKGGDPHVFGRGGEEAQHLAAADVPFEVVPGVSSAVGAPGVAGIPLTHRDCASSVTVVTGHETPDKDESALDWDALADTVVSGGTLVVLMGVRRLSNNVAALRDHGVPAETPVAMVQKATWRDERTVSGTLATIEAEKEAAGIEPPAVTVVGNVVDVRADTRELLDR